MACNVAPDAYAQRVDVTVENATRADARALAALRCEVAQQLMREHGGGPWAVCPTKATVIRQMRASHMLLARRSEQLLGTVRLIRANPVLFDASAFTPVGVALYVIGLAVSPQARGQGVGRALVDACKDIARAWPAQALWLDTYENAVGAGRFYDKCGFRKTGTRSLNAVPSSFYEWHTEQR